MRTRVLCSRGERRFDSPVLAPLTLVYLGVLWTMFRVHYREPMTEWTVAYYLVALVGGLWLLRWDAAIRSHSRVVRFLWWTPAALTVLTLTVASLPVAAVFLN